MIRFEDGAWVGERHMLLPFMLATVATQLLVIYLSGLYGRLWVYASVKELEKIAVGGLLSSVAAFAMGVVLLPLFGVLAHRVPLSVVVLDGFLASVSIALPRVLSRLRRRRTVLRRPHPDAKRVIIAGAGAAGDLIVREMRLNPQLNLIPVAFLDDDPNKHGLRLHDLPVVAGIERLEEVAADFAAQEVVVALPSASGRVLREIVRRANAVGIAARTVPGLYEILSGHKAVSSLRKIEIQYLLRRDPIATDLQQVRSLVAGRTVLVTGAGGSIGSELSRQLALQFPERIVAVGRGENSIFELMQELQRDFPGVEVDPVIADVRDLARMTRIFADHRPYSVFHAAAHKHVPLMEANVPEAILNNILGTRNVVELSAHFDVEHFVLISTDKAVRPTSVMGATKRMAECIVHDVGCRLAKPYVCVRFGNVLGSRGSVIPTFLRQIADGGPVTVTHPDMTRYFMTIPEAVQLVLQAAAMGRHGEVFVLDMGEPVKVVDLAADLIRLSGYEVDVDVEIAFTGLRPGEKLFEELFVSPESVVPTSHPKIMRARDDDFGQEALARIPALLDAARQGMHPRELRRLISEVVPEYLGRVDTGEFSIADVVDHPRTLISSR